MRRLFFGARPSAPRLYLLTALALAFLLVPAAAASAANKKASVEILGGGSGRVFGEGPLNGNPPLECHKPSQVGDVCETEMNKNEGLVGQLFVEEAAPGSKFVKWEVIQGIPVGCEEPTAPECGMLSLGTPVKVKATFELAGPPPVALTINKPGTGAGQVNCEVGGGPTVDKPCASSYPQGTELKLIAAPGEGSAFAGFENATGSAAACEAEGSPCGPFTLEEASELDAVFALETRELEIAEEGPGTVEVQCKEGPSFTACADPLTELPYGTEVKVTAHPEEPGAELESISGTNSAFGCTASPCTFKITEDSEVSVIFALETFALTVNTSGEGTVEAQCDEGAGFEPCGPLTELPYGTQVKLTAEAEIGWEFSAWSGDCDTTFGDECELEIDADKTVEATFVLAGQKTLTIVTSGGTGTGQVNCEVNGGPTVDAPCKAAYTEGTQLKLLPVEGANSTFAGYNTPTGSISCTGKASCEFTIAANSSVKAPFDLEKHLLMVTKAGSGTGTVTSSPAGIACGATCSAEFDHGKEVTLEAVSGANTKAVEWSGACTVEAGKCKATMSAVKAVTATFPLEKHLLTVTKAGSGTGTVTSSPAGIACGATCSAEFDHGKEVTLEAVSGANTKAVEWSGACTVEAGKCKATMSAVKAVTATFPLEKHLLTVTKAGSGTGTVTSSPAGIACGATCSAEFDHGKEVTLEAVSGANTKAVEWSGACTVEAGKCKATMSAVKAVTATFPLEKHLLTVTKAGSGTGTVTCDGGACAAEYDHGAEVTLAASAASGSTFAGWSGAGCSGTGSCEVTIEADTAVTATFTANPVEPEKTCANTPSLCPAPPVEKCTVPKLKNKTLGQAKSALKAAHCALGKVTKPKKAKGALVVKSSSPGAGTVLPEGSKVNLKLGPKPKKKK